MPTFEIQSSIEIPPVERTKRAKSSPTVEKLAAPPTSRNVRERTPSLRGVPLEERVPGKSGMTGKMPKFDPEFFRKRPTQERLRFLYDCDENAVLTRRVIHSPFSRAKVGSVVKGGIDTAGYRQITVDGKVYLYHHIIWVWHNGYWPENQIDHIDRDRLNNRITNLREVSHSCNARNCSTGKTNITKVKGVTYHSRDKKYMSSIRVDDTLRFLGNFTDLTEAVCHRYAAEQCLNWNTCDLNSPAYQYLNEQGVIK